METFAHLRAAQNFGVPLIGLRGISDGAEELRQVSDWTQYLHLVDQNLAEAVDMLEAALVSGRCCCRLRDSSRRRGCPHAKAICCEAAQACRICAEMP